MDSDDDLEELNMLGRFGLVESDRQLKYLELRKSVIILCSLFRMKLLVTQSLETW